MQFVEKGFDMRGMKRAELVDYFLSIGGKTSDYEKILGQGWQVEVGNETLITMCSLKFPATLVILRCREDILEEMMDAFRLRFLSAGG